jgi:hypothetical protein
MRVSGPFEETLAPLLTKLEVPRTSPDRLIVPCLVQQLPAVKQYFPSSVVVKTVQQCADAQASLRTLTLRPELYFPYHIKLSLACNITSALRTITPWTTIGGPVYTELLERFLPPDLWVFREVAAITGSQTDFNKAKHLSCILRTDLEERARMNNERLILAAALAHHPPDADKPYAQILYNLESLKDRQHWFRRYLLPGESENKRSTRLMISTQLYRLLVQPRSSTPTRIWNRARSTRPKHGCPHLPPNRSNQGICRARFRWYSFTRPHVRAARGKARSSAFRQRDADAQFT